MSLPRALSLFASFALTPGCVIVFGGGDKPDEPYPYYEDTAYGYACTDEARASVMVSVVDFEGAPVPDALVQWTGADRESFGTAECLDSSCSSRVAGWEVEGDITVTVQLERPSEDPACSWTTFAEQSVYVPRTEDGCHVMTQEMFITLPAPALECIEIEGDPPDDPGDTAESPPSGEGDPDDGC